MKRILNFIFFGRKKNFTLEYEKNKKLGIHVTHFETHIPHG